MKHVTIPVWVLLPGFVALALPLDASAGRVEDYSTVTDFARFRG